jgi:hypothetical protein
MKKRGVYKHPISVYRKGGKGFCEWCDEVVHVPIYPEGSDIPEWYPLGNLPKETNPKTGKSYYDLWEEQKRIFTKALEMKGGRFVFRLIVLCWMRGEGKSLGACLIQLWKFFCWPRQLIMLGANSRDQVKFVHYDIMRDIIINSPKLFRAVGGKRNIQEKEIRLKDNKGNLVSLIRSISSFSGIVSNITGYTFSEIFDMKNPRFFVQLDGSIRNIPNALGVIDSTVSAKTHVLYQLYHNWKQNKSKTVFFSYRSSRDADQRDYWNPHMDTDQLEDYKLKFPFGEFEKYFQNLWSAGSMQPFTDEMIEAMGYLGMDGQVGNQTRMLEVLAKKNKHLEQSSDLAERGVMEAMVDAEVRIDKLMERFTPVESIYKLQTHLGLPRMARMEDLLALGDYFDTDWVIGVGVDRADPMKIRTSARTLVTVTAKGLPGSRSNPFMQVEIGGIPQYIYVKLNLVHVESSSLEDIKDIIKEAHEDYDGVDVVCGERWGMWDLAPWCEEMDIEAEFIFPTYDRQKEAFSEFFIAVKQGRFKTPQIAVPGSKKDDILREEMQVFDHDADKRWFGSPEKEELYGVQDDSIFAEAWGMYGVRLKGVDDFRMRRPMQHFGIMFDNKGLLGAY